MKKADRVRDIAGEIEDLLDEARNISRTNDPGNYSRFNEYVFKQIMEHVRKGNPYNQDLEDVANSLEDCEEEEDLDCEEEELDCEEEEVVQ